MHPSDTKYTVAEALAGDLAESCLADLIGQNTGRGSRDAAKAIRELSDSNTDQGGSLVQEYRMTKYAIRSAVWKLLDGHGGYKLVKQ